MQAKITEIRAKRPFLSQKRLFLADFKRKTEDFKQNQANLSYFQPLFLFLILLGSRYLRKYRARRAHTCVKYSDITKILVK